VRAVAFAIALPLKTHWYDKGATPLALTLNITFAPKLTD
jgi:hypothetical protein